MITTFKDIRIGYYFRNYNGDVFQKLSKATFREVSKETIIRTSSRSLRTYFVLGENTPVHIVEETVKN
jgi:hypothetical protein